MNYLRIDPHTGEVWSKSDIGVTQHYNSLNDFYADGATGAMYAMAARKYYNL